MDWYNGYKPRERQKKYDVYKKKVADGTLTPIESPCQLCGDPNCKLEPHDEDYSEEYIWTPSAELNWPP